AQARRALPGGDRPPAGRAAPAPVTAPGPPRTVPTVGARKNDGIWSWRPGTRMGQPDRVNDADHRQQPSRTPSAPGARPGRDDPAPVAGSRPAATPGGAADAGGAAVRHGTDAQDSGTGTRPAGGAATDGGGPAADGGDEDGWVPA